MADNPFQYFQGKRNSALTKFLEDNQEFSRLVRKLVSMIATVATEQRVSASEITFELAVPRGHERITSDGGMIIAIKCTKPRGIIG